MNKKQLKAYKDIAAEIEQIEGNQEDTREEIKQIEADIDAIGDPTTAKVNALPGGSGGISDPTGNHAVQLDELRAQHQAQLERLKDLAKMYADKLVELYAAKLAIENAIETLEPRERRLVRLYYIDGLTWEQVCVEMHYSWNHIHRLHRAVLEKLRDL